MSTDGHDETGTEASSSAFDIDVDGPTGRGTGPRSAFLIAGALALVLVAGAVIVAVRLLGGGGTQPAAVVPDDAIAYVGIDLDPPAGQKIEAYRFLRAFPELRERAPEEQEDLRQFLIDLVLEEETDCKLTWQDDFEPWLGQRAALIVRPGKDEPQILAAIQAGDEEAARTAFAAFDKCDGAEGTTGVAFSDGYAILAETQKEADAAVAKASSGALETLPSFQALTERAGQDGVIEAWFGNDLIQEFFDSAGLGLSSEERKTFDEIYGGELDGALTVRFADAGLEAVAAVRSGKGATSAPSKAITLADMPATTALALAFGVNDSYQETLEETLKNLAEFAGPGPGGDPLKQLERETGLKLPEDIATLVGNEFGLALREDVISTTTDQFENGGPMDIPSPPFALITDTPESDVQAVLDKLAPLIAPLQIGTASGSIGTAYGPDQQWNDELAAGGGGQRLGDLPEFGSVLPDIEGAEIAFFLNFNGQLADDFRKELSRKEAKEFDDVVGPMSAFGITGVTEDDVQVVRMRLGTD